MAEFKKTAEYSRYYGDFSGVDLSSSPSGLLLSRCCDMRNMYRDYYGSDGASLETVPGFRRLHSFSVDTERRKINSLLRFSPSWEDGEFIAVHAGKRLFLYPVSAKDGEDFPIMPEKEFSQGVTGDYATLSDKKSRMFEHDGKLFILDGENYSKKDENGVQNVKDIAYVPTTYADGEKYEQRNLLSDSFYCKFNLSESIQKLNRYEYKSDGLIYSITGDGVCEVVGTADTKAKELFIPSQTEINGQIYYVESISPIAFREMTSLEKVTVSNGIKKIGNNAFFLCTSLLSVTLPDSVETLGDGIFLRCDKLNTVTLGAKISTIPKNTFLSTNLNTIYYSGSYESWSAIQKDSQNPDFSEINIVYNNRNYQGAFCFYINEKCESLLSVTLDGEEMSKSSLDSVYYTQQSIDKNGKKLVDAIIIHARDYTSLYGKVLQIKGKATFDKDEKESTGAILFNKGDYSYSVIAECTVCERFDGRIFFSGNPRFPSAVFYSARNLSGENDPTYIGALNYFFVGREDSEVRALVSSGDKLFVFKSDNEKGGVYIYSGADTENDILVRVYTLTDAVQGVGSSGDAGVFYGDTVFVSERGLDAVGKKQLNGEISVEHRSSNIDGALLGGDLSRVRLCFWCGYLVLLRDGEIFLADSRQTFRHKTGDVQYEWYRLSEIGTYENQYSRFFPVELPKEYEDLYIKHGESYIALSGKEDDGEIEQKEVFSSFAYEIKDGEWKKTNREVFYCISRDGDGIFNCYMCDSNGEMTGGEYFPATELCSCDGVLFFGTAGGDLCCFNTDKRDEKGSIDRRYYTFDGRRYFSGFSTKSDDCDIPNMTKSTVKHSLCVRLRSFGSGQIKIMVRTDQDKWKNVASSANGVFAFDDTEFDAFTFNTSSRVTLVIPEKEKRWSEKQYHVYSDEYKRPFGIFDISYRYKVAGRIKQK